MTAREWLQLVGFIAIIVTTTLAVSDWVREWQEERERRRNDSERSDSNGDG